MGDEFSEFGLAVARRDRTGSSLIIPAAFRSLCRVEVDDAHANDIRDRFEVVYRSGIMGLDRVLPSSRATCSTFWYSG
jgi:hypothetical protein